MLFEGREIVPQGVVVNYDERCSMLASEVLEGFGGHESLPESLLALRRLLKQHKQKNASTLRKTGTSTAR